MTGGWPVGVSCDTASQATTWRRRSARGRRGAQVGRTRSWAQARSLCARAAGPVGCALGALSLF